MTIISTMKGKKIDVGAIFAAQGDIVAIGNASMNARGDVLGSGGKIIKDSTTISKEYNAHNPKAVKRVSLAELTPETLLSPADAMAEFKRRAAAAAADDETPVEHQVTVVEETQATAKKKRRLVDGE